MSTVSEIIGRTTQPVHREFQTDPDASLPVAQMFQNLSAMAAFHRSFCKRKEEGVVRNQYKWSPSTPFTASVRMPGKTSSSESLRNSELPNAPLSQSMPQKPDTEWTLVNPSSPKEKSPEGFPDWNWVDGTDSQLQKEVL